MELSYLSLFLLQLESQFFGLVVKLHQTPVVAVVTVVAVVVVVIAVAAATAAAAAAVELVATSLLPGFASQSSS